MKLKQKEGISLIVLIITIALILIITSAVILNINVSVQNANLSRFANDLSYLQDSVKSMYILENKLPVKDIEKTLSRETVLNLASNKNRDFLRTELANNGESEDVTFYEIDMKKVGSDMKQVGAGKNGKDDIYVVSNDSLKVYYLKGLLYRKKMYFSLNSDIANIVKLDNVNNKDMSTTSVYTFSGITVSKPTSGYSNNLDIKILANIDEGEILKIKYDGIVEKALMLARGRTTIQIGDITDFNVYFQTPLTDKELEAFNNLVGSNRYIYLNKYKEGNNIGSYKIDISNYDNMPPMLEVDEIQKLEEFYIVNGITKDNNGIAKSGVVQVKYEYIDENTTSSDQKIDENYMKNKAKSISIDEDGKFSLKVPKDVTKMKIASVDKVGNIIIKDVNLE